MDCRQDGAKLSAKTRASLLFNTTIAGIDEADAILIVGSNPRESPVMSTYPQNFLHGRTPIAHLGTAADLTYPVEHLGEDISILEQLASGKHPFAADEKSKNLWLSWGWGHCAALMAGQ